MSQVPDLLTRALEWIARLPLCGEPELAGLLDVDEHAARRLIHALATRGWIETFEPGSAELELRRLGAVREEAISALAAALSCDQSQIVAFLPKRSSDTLERVTRVEIAVGVNRFFADLAADGRQSGLAELLDARSLPLALSPSERWWLPRSDGYGCLRAGTLHAPFFLAWDRAAAPDLSRRRRAAAWLAARAAVSRHWGAEGLPPLLVICPSNRELRVWQRALVERDQTDAPRLEVLLTTREQLQIHGAGACGWQWPDRTSSASLVEVIGWGQAPPIAADWLAEPVDDLPNPGRRSPSLRERALAAAASPGGGPVSYRVGVLALATNAAEKTLIEWIARHPLLSAAQLAALEDAPKALIERRVEWLLRCGAVRFAEQTTDRKGTIT